MLQDMPTEVAAEQSATMSFRKIAALAALADVFRRLGIPKEHARFNLAIELVNIRF